MAALFTQGQILVTSIVNHREEIDASDLLTPNEAGENLVSTYETVSNFNQLDIYNVALTKNWRITVTREDLNWHPSLAIYIKRTANGNPAGTGIDLGSSPTGYIEITAFEDDFLLGQGAVTGIECMIQVTGISITLPVDNYSTDIIYTLYGD